MTTRTPEHNAPNAPPRRGGRGHIVRVVGLIWRHTSALVAVVLIALAFYFGFLAGTPDPPADDDAAAHAHDQASSEVTAGGASAPQMYTCSMHPAVRLPDPDAKCPICFMDLIAATDEDSDPASRRRLRLSAEAAALSDIQTVPVQQFMPRAEVRLYGTLTYDETRIARLTARFPGRIERLYLHYLGTPIQAGDHVVDIYSPELLAAFEELRQARLAADDARSSSSAIVRDSSEQALNAARERLRLLGLEADLLERIETAGFDDDVFTIRSPNHGIVTSVAVVEGEYLKMGSPIATVSDLDRLWLNLEAYESQLALLRWGQPVQFTVAARPGEAYSGQIAYIEPEVDTRTRTATVRVAVDNESRDLRPGMYASAVVRPRVTASGAAPGDELAGRWVSPMHPEIVKDGPGQCDVCGMDLVPAETLGVVGDATLAREPLVVPRSSVLITGRRAVVYVRLPDTEQPTFEGREIVLGPRAGEHYIVLDGLKAGEEVVTNGAFRIDSEMQIRAKPSMMNPEEGGADRRLVWGGHGRFGAGDDGDSAAPGPAVPEQVLFALTPVYASYFRVQEALADDDFEAALAAAADFALARSLAQPTGLVGEQLGAWRRAIALLPDANALADLATIDEVRTAFEAWSDGVLQLERTFGHRGSQMFHLAYCPMAFDNRGADWLQRGDTVDNPYFGSMMLRCGEIQDAFAPVDQDHRLPANQRTGGDS